MPKHITPKAKKKYLESGGNHCPFCGGGEIEADAVSYKHDFPTQLVRCLDCGKAWTDTLGVVDVEEIKD